MQVSITEVACEGKEGGVVVARRGSSQLRSPLCHPCLSKFTLNCRTCNTPHFPHLQGVEGFTYDYYEDLTPDDVVKIIDAFKRGEKPKV